MNGTVAFGAPSQNEGAPSAAGIVVGTPSPDAPGNTSHQPVGNSSSFTDSFSNFISGLEKSTVGAITAVTNKIKYKGDVVLGTIERDYNQGVAGAYNILGATATTAQNVAKAVTNTSSLITLAIIAIIAYPLILSLRKK